MKEFLKALFTLRPPWGEVWLGLGIVTIAFAIGLINRSAAAEWLLAIATLALLLLAPFLFYLFWKRTAHRGRSGYIIGFLVLTLIASFPFHNDTDDAYGVITNKHGMDVFQRIKAATPECTDDGVGAGYFPFGTDVSYCGYYWFVLFNKFPFKVSGGEVPPMNFESQWREYENEAHGYAIEYPLGLEPYESEEVPGNWPSYSSTVFKKLPNEIVGFGVQVFTEGFTSAEDWLARRQAQITFGESEYVVERTITIGNEEAIVTFWREVPEHEVPFEYGRSTAFMRDGTLYVIGTRGMSEKDRVRVWNSFRFIE